MLNFLIFFLIHFIFQNQIINHSIDLLKCILNFYLIKFNRLILFLFHVVFMLNLQFFFLIHFIFLNQIIDHPINIKKILITKSFKIYYS